MRYTSLVVAAAETGPVAHPRARRARAADLALPALSVAAGLGVWELVSRTGVVSERDLPAMTTSFRALWTLLQTEHFWGAFLHTVRGWALGLGIATALSVPIGIALGSSRLA